MAVQQELPLPPPVSSGVCSINARCILRTEGEHRVVVVAGLPVHHYSARDAVAAAYAMVFLADAGYASQKEVAVAFNCSERTVRRHQERYHDGGMAALATRSGWRAGRRRVPTKRLRLIQSLKAQGLSNREIARRLGVTENAIRQEVGPSSEPGATQQLLPFDTTENTADRASATSTVMPEPASLEPTSPSRTGQASPAIAEETVSVEPEEKPGTVTLYTFSLAAPRSTPDAPSRVSTQPGFRPDLVCAGRLRFIGNGEFVTVYPISQDHGSKLGDKRDLSESLTGAIQNTFRPSPSFPTLCRSLQRSTAGRTSRTAHRV